MTRIETGASSYFSTPSNILDPHLFDGDHLQPYVRETINNLLFSYLDTQYNNAHNWTMVWLAGSGVSYQWSADRGNGDLDVLFGIDYSQFVTDNPQFEYMSIPEIANAIDDDLRKSLWPTTSAIEFPIASFPMGPVQFYEMTFFLNPYVTNDPDSIVNIHPYAAYNVTEDQWTVRPTKGTADAFPADYERKAADNLSQAQQYVDRYEYLTQQMSMVLPNSPQWHNFNTSLTLLKSFVKTMFDEIHLGRQNAFSQQGEGFGDFYNYQWQAAKRDGIVRALNDILHMEH